jgi:hypothetical protein
VATGEGACTAATAASLPFLLPPPGSAGGGWGRGVRKPPLPSAAGDRAPERRRSCQSRSRRKTSRSANSIVVDVASPVVSDDDNSTHPAYSASSRAVAELSATSTFSRLRSSPRTSGPERGSDLGRPARRFVVFMLFLSVIVSRSIHRAVDRRDISGPKCTIRRPSRSREIATVLPIARANSGDFGISVSSRRWWSTSAT